MANVPMKASDRRGYDHMAAYFNDRNLPVQVEYYLSNGSLNKREVMEYNKEKELVRKGEVNSKGKYIKLIVYSNNEPWSREYQKWNYSGKERFNFTEQRSIFSIPRGEQSIRVWIDPIKLAANNLTIQDLIAKEIEEKRIISSKNPIIPHMENDQLILKTGQAYEIDYVGANQNGIQFRLKESDGLLTIPFDNVRSLTSRMGDVIYPEAIEYRKSQ